MQTDIEVRTCETV